MGYYGGLGDVFSSDYPIGRKKCTKCGHAHNKKKCGCGCENNEKKIGDGVKLVKDASQ
jgi:hypothetical protein